MEMPAPIVQTIQSLAKRLESAQELVRRDAVKPTDRPDLFRVGYSGSSSHEVGTGSSSQPAGCTCPDYRFRGSQLGGWCKHRLAVEIYVGAHPEAAKLTEQAAREKLERDIADLF